MMQAQGMPGMAPNNQSASPSLSLFPALPRSRLSRDRAEPEALGDLFANIHTHRSGLPAAVPRRVIRPGPPRGRRSPRLRPEQLHDESRHARLPHGPAWHAPAGPAGPAGPDDSAHAAATATTAAATAAAPTTATDASAAAASTAATTAAAAAAEPDDGPGVDPPETPEHSARHADEHHASPTAAVLDASAYGPGTDAHESAPATDGCGHASDSDLLLQHQWRHGCPVDGRRADEPDDRKLGKREVRAAAGHQPRAIIRVHPDSNNAAGAEKGARCHEWERSGQKAYRGGEFVSARLSSVCPTQHTLACRRRSSCLF